MIVIENIVKKYGQVAAVSDVSLTVKPGEIYGFIGPNGAGKSTTIKILLNYIFQDKGTATILNYDVNTHSKLIKQDVGYVPSEVNFYQELSCFEIIKLAMEFHDVVNDDYAHELCRAFQIEEDKKMKNLSLGNKKKVAIVSALVFKPKVLIMDEPTNGLDPLIQSVLFRYLKLAAADGVSVLVSSHNLHEVQAHCSHVAFIKDGKIIKDAKISDSDHQGIYIKATGDIGDLGNHASHILKQSKESLSFIYKGDLKSILAVLSQLSLTELVLEPVSIEHQFSEFYQKEV